MNIRKSFITKVNDSTLLSFREIFPKLNEIIKAHGFEKNGVDTATVSSGVNPRRIKMTVKKNKEEFDAEFMFYKESVKLKISNKEKGNVLLRQINAV